MAVMFSGGDAGQWEWPASPTTEATSEHLHDVHEPGWAPLSLAVAADTPWPAVHLPAVPGRMEGYDVAVLSHLDARDHPGTSESIVAAAATWRVRALGGSLTEAEVRAVLTVAGFEGVLFDEALRVSFGESVGWQPRIMGDGGRAYGLFQLHADPWAGWCGVTPEELLEPVVNATCARRIVMEYEVPRGYPRWSNWSVKP